MKKTKDQRKKVLLAARPNMAAVHRPDMLALTKETPQQRANGSIYRDVYLWPYLNIEDLVRQRSLLLLLNSRGRHLPDAFAHADFEGVHVGSASGALRPAFLDSHTMLLNGQHTAETYGQLIAWKDNEDAFTWLRSGVGFHPGMGLMVMELQQEILRFLVQCCQTISGDFPER